MASFAEKLQSINKFTLYLLLILATSIPLFFTVNIPSTVSPSTKDLYQALMKLPEGSTILIQSDWTNSTRGESAGQLESLLRICRARDIRFVIYSGADPQAPQVARDTIARLNEEFAAAGIEPLRRWEDFVDLGFFPDLETLAQSMRTNLRRTFESRTNPDPNGVSRPVFESPVLANVKEIGDIGVFVNITGSGTIPILIERLGPDSVPIMGMITGVMGPEHVNYYSAGQIKGVSIGLRGVVELESMMANGVNSPGEDGKVVVPDPRTPDVTPPLTDFEPNVVTWARGRQYFLPLHVALSLLILAVVVGNVGLIAGKKRGAR